MSADIKFDTSDHDFQVYSLSETDRMGFIRKVYGILSVQLLLTTFFVILGCSSTAYQSFLENNTWLIISSMILNIVSICMLFCCLSNARKVPNNYILCGIFTLTESIMVSAIVTLYDPQTVLIVTLMTAAITVSLTSYAYYTKKDYSEQVGIVLVILVAAILFAIFAPIFYYSRFVEVLISSLFAIVYGIYIVIDTQMIAGGGRYELSYDDYIIGSMMLYVDIIGLFIYLLKIFGERR